MNWVSLASIIRQISQKDYQRFKKNTYLKNKPCQEAHPSAKSNVVSVTLNCGVFCVFLRIEVIIGRGIKAKTTLLLGLLSEVLLAELLS